MTINRRRLAGLWKPPTVAAGGVTFSLVWTASATDTAGGTSVTYSSLSFGADDANRVVAVVVQNRNSAAPTVTGVTIGGVTASQVSGAAGVGGLAGSDVWYATHAGGLSATSGNVVVTYANSSTRSAVNVYRIITSTPTPSAGANAGNTGVTTLIAAITVPSGGGAIAGQLWRSASNGNDITWTNAVKDHTDIQVATFTTVGAATVSGTGSVTVTGAISGIGGTDASQTMAAWGP